MAKKKHIDWDKVDSLLQAQCFGVGISQMLGIHENTLYERCKDEKGMDFGDYSALKKAEGLELLRAKQFDSAMSGDKAMQIFLGKNYLGQSDKQAHTHKTEPELPFIVEVVRRTADPETEDQAK